MQLKGLPEGVELVEIADGPRSDVFYWANMIRGGKDFTVNQGSIIVKPAPGYDFQYDITMDSYIPVKQFADPATITVEFRFTNEFDEQRVKQCAARIPGFVKIAEGNDYERARRA